MIVYYKDYTIKQYLTIIWIYTFKMIKKDLNISLSAMKKFNHIFNKREKTTILDEALFFSFIYTSVPLDKLG